MKEIDRIIEILQALKSGKELSYIDKADNLKVHLFYNPEEDRFFDKVEDLDNGHVREPLRLTLPQAFNIISKYMQKTDSSTSCDGAAEALEDSGKDYMDEILKSLEEQFNMAIYID